MLLSVVSLLVVAQSSSEFPEGLMNNPVQWETKADFATKTPRKMLFLCFTLKHRQQFRKLFDLYEMLSS